MDYSILVACHFKTSPRARLLAQLAIPYICGNIGTTEVQEAQQVAAHAHNLEAQAHAHAEAQVQAAVQAHSLAAKAQAHANAQVTDLP